MVAPVGRIHGPAAPVNRLRIVLGNTLARAIQLIKVELRTRISVLGGLAIPVNRFGVVPGDACAFGVHHTEECLR